MRTLVYGGGAVGLGIASCLLKSGDAVDIVARRQTVAALGEDGLTRMGIFGRYHAEPSAFGAFASLEDIRRGHYDYILVCTKSFDSRLAAEDIARHGGIFGGATKVVHFQNGWGNAEEFAALLGRDRVYSARVITGFRRSSAAEVTITVHADSIHIGSLFGAESSPVEALCESISRGAIPCRSTNEVAKDLWAKMLYNCALNPLGAILRVPYGVLAGRDSTREIMDAVVAEVFEVMTAAGYVTHWKSADDFLEVFYAKLVPDTAEHKSSTLQDIAAGKRTEIDALNGAVIALARKHGVLVPHNAVVYNLIKSMEAGLP